MRKDLTYMRREKGMQWRDIGEALGVSFSGCYKQFESSRVECESALA
jgi:hypothetical protein